MYGAKKCKDKLSVNSEAADFFITVQETNTVIEKCNSSYLFNLKISEVRY